MTDEQANLTFPGSTDSSLLRRVRAKDQDAWNRFVQLYSPLVYAWIGHEGLFEADRADVFQEVFLAVARYIQDFHRDQASHSLRAWMRTITRSKIADHDRQKLRDPMAAGGTDAQRRLEALESPPGSGERAESDAPEAAALARQALAMICDRFETKTWTAFWRTVIDGVPATEVADELNLTPEAVRKAKSRVLRYLKDEFGHLLE
jgi:RNA polymerase sigma-70 factor (ECF subfamily)